jgi:hypothetical protein
MKIELPLYQGLIIDNFTYEVSRTIDFSKDQKFMPVILITAKNINIMHECDMFDYINNTWTDKDVENAIESYLKKLQVKY